MMGVRNVGFNQQSNDKNNDRVFADLLHFRDLDFKTTARVNISEFISFILKCDRVQYLRPCNSI